MQNNYTHTHTHLKQYIMHYINVTLWLCIGASCFVCIYYTNNTVFIFTVYTRVVKLLVNSNQFTIHATGQHHITP